MLAYKRTMTKIRKETRTPFKLSGFFVIGVLQSDFSYDRLNAIINGG